MLIKAPRWVLIVEGIVILGAAGVVAYKAAMWVRPLGRVEQPQPKVDPKVRVHEYYEEYPASYIRISRESWRYADGSRTAYHSFTLTNGATVGYDHIQVELTYQSSGGRSLRTETVTLPQALAALGSVHVAGLGVKNVPPDSDRVVLRVVAAKVMGK